MQKTAFSAFLRDFRALSSPSTLAIALEQVIKCAMSGKE